MNGREIVVGVTGGIACYKTAVLVSQLVQAGARVSVVMTESAQEFVGPATFEALSGRPVYSRMFHDAEFPLGAHIGLATRGELLCVAPATANFLAKAAHGCRRRSAEHAAAGLCWSGAGGPGHEHRRCGASRPCSAMSNNYAPTAW